MRVEIHDEAIQELDDEVRYLDERRTGYGDRFYAAATNALALIADFPQIGRKEGPVRMKRILDFPHSVAWQTAPRLLAASPPQIDAKAMIQITSLRTAYS